jgi:hypothetical protein
MATYLLWRTSSALGVWIMPIVVGALVAAAATGSSSWYRNACPDYDDVIVRGERPFAVVTVYYPAKYIEVIKTAQREGHNVLRSFRALDSAWSAAAPATPLAIKTVYVPLPEPFTGRQVFPVLEASLVTDTSTFQSLLPILEDLRELILDGDGSGRGRLTRSRCAARPAAPNENLLAGSRIANRPSRKATPIKPSTKPAVSY